MYMNMDIKRLRKETGLPFLLLKKIIDEHKLSNSRNVDRLFRKYMSEYADQFKERATKYSTFSYYSLYNRYAVVEILSETNNRELTEILSEFATSIARRLIFNEYLPNLDKEFCELRCKFGENIKLGKTIVLEKSFSQKVFGFYTLKQNNKRVCNNRLCAVTIETQEMSLQLSYLEGIAKLIAKNAMFYYGEYLETRKEFTNLDFIDFLHKKHLLFCDDYVNVPSLAKTITIAQHLELCSNILCNNEGNAYFESRSDRLGRKKTNRISIKNIEVFGVE